MDLSPKSRGSYFSPEFFKFLKSLARSNNRVWFQKNKQRYERYVLAPSLRFIKDAGAELRAVSPYLVADPRPFGGSLFRIYRDIRFSKDKSPTRPMSLWSSGTVEEERSLTPGYTFTLHRETVLPVQAYGILTLRPSTWSVARSCPGPRLGDESGRVG